MQRVSHGSSGLQHRAVAERLPGRAAEVAVQIGGRGDQHLRLHRRIARGIQQDQPAVVFEGVAVDRPARIPVAGGPQDRIARIAREVQPIVGHGMAQGVVPAVAVGVVEQMHLAAQHNRFAVRQAVALAFLLRQHLAGFLPVHQIPALGDPHGPARRLRLVGSRRHRVVHQVPPPEFDDRRVLRERPPMPRGVAEHHARFGGRVRSGQRGRRRQQQGSEERKLLFHDVGFPE